VVKKILFALDILTNSQHRESHRSNGDWEAYHSSFSDDEPNTAIIELVNVLSEYYAVYTYSDMDEKYRQSIMDWLVDNGVYVEDVLLSNSRGSIAVRRLEAVEGHEPEFVFEGHPVVIEELREKGCVVFECLN